MKFDYFAPRKMASWWSTLDDLRWPEKQVLDKIKRRAEGFARAGIDTAINFGFHTRFDFADHFHVVHGYLASVSSELAKYGIRYMDHYTCTIVQRPRGERDFTRLHATHRHHVLHYPDAMAATYAQYAGHRFRDICETDVRDGQPGYSWIYQTELFCHNNPNFLDMHEQYLRRLLAEVPMDGIMVDDMCDYGGLATCACPHCRERLRRDYGHELPAFGDPQFWGDTSGDPFSWGNYNNPALRDWLRMKADSVADHVARTKRIVGDLPLMTCCSSTGPIRLNAITLDLERMVGALDFVMLENCGISVDTVNWSNGEAEALQQKTIAANRGGVPALALSYTIFDDGAYLGWALARFWGVSNWSSTLLGRLDGELDDAKQIEDMVGPLNRWEAAHSDFSPMTGRDVVEVRLVNNSICRRNGWRDEEGREHWDRVGDWAKSLIARNIGYGFVIADQLADPAVLVSENTPVILDGVGCASDAQFEGLQAFLRQGGTVWLRLPFGTHDESGFERPEPLSNQLCREGFAGLQLIEAKGAEQALTELVATEKFRPRIIQLSGQSGWAVRLRAHGDQLVLHVLNQKLKGVAHPTLHEAMNGRPILKKIVAKGGGAVAFSLDLSGLRTNAGHWNLLSPELGRETRPAETVLADDGRTTVRFDVTDLRLYGVLHASRN